MTDPNLDEHRHAPPTPGSSGGATGAALFVLAVVAVVVVAGGLTLMVSMLRSSRTPPQPAEPPPVVRPAPRPPAEEIVDAVEVEKAPEEPEDEEDEEIAGGILEIVDIPDIDPSSGCGIPRESGIFRFETQRDKARLKWVVYVPRDYQPNRLHPVIIHNASRHRTIDFVLEHRGFKPIADREGALLIGVEKDRGRLPGGTLASMSDVVADLHRLYCVDRQRIYAVGVAKGERDTRELADVMELSAIAGSGNRLDADFDGTNPGPNEPIPYMHLFGKDNGEIPHAGGMSLCNDKPVMSFEQDREVRRKHHGCSDKEVVYYESQYGKCVTWEKCKKAPLVVCEVDGGREWPGEPAVVPGFCGPGRSSNFPYAETIWEFWQREGRLLELPDSPPDR